jgi:hypothetical protein
MLLRVSTFLSCIIYCASGVAFADANSAPQSPPAVSVADSTQKALSANYALLCEAALDPTDAKFASAVSSLAPNFIDVDSTGAQHSRDEFVTSTRDQFRSMAGTKCNNAIESIAAPDASTVVIVNTQDLSGDTQASDGKHRVEYLDTTRDTWQLENGTWLQTQAKELHVVVKVDGTVIHDSNDNSGVHTG